MPVPNKQRPPRKVNAQALSLIRDLVDALDVEWEYVREISIIFPSRIEIITEPVDGLVEGEEFRF